MSLFSFRKEERLSRKKSIDELFKKGSSFYKYPFKTYWLLAPTGSESPAQLLVIVSKRSFKRAVDRNRVKRLIREIYRNEKPGFYEFLKANNQQCLLCLIYTSNNIPEHSELDKKIKLVFRRLISEIETKLNNIERSLSDK